MYIGTKFSTVYTLYCRRFRKDIKIYGEKICF